MYSNTRLVLMGCAAGAALLWADMLYGAGREEGRSLSQTSDSELDPSPDDDSVEPDDTPSPTESDEE